MPSTPEALLTQFQIAALAPEVVLCCFALAVLLCGAFYPPKARSVELPILALAGIALSAVAIFALWNKGLFFGPEARAIFVADRFSLFFKGIFLLSLAVTILISGRFLKRPGHDHHTVAGEYYALLMLATVGMMMVASARDLLVVFLGIETLSIALYVLCGFSRGSLKGNEAALKYFLLGAFATGFLLYGIALTYFATGSTLLPEIFTAIDRDKNLATGQPVLGAFFAAGMAMMLIGLGFKTGLVPFHQWTPDVYEGAPTPVTAFMATGAKAAAFAAFLRVFTQALGAEGASEQWHHIVLILAVLTMIIGNVVALAQDGLKRMLAYSSIAHAGYVMVGVLALGSALRNGGPAGHAAATANAGLMLYLAFYAVMNLGALAVLSQLEGDAADGTVRSSDLRGLAWRQPLAAGTLMVFLLSLAGIPPTIGFFGKLYVFSSAVDQGLVGLALVGVISSVISFTFYARPIVEMFMHDAPSDFVVNADGAAAGRAGWSAAASVAIMVCAALAICAAGTQTFFDWTAADQLLPR